MLAIGSTPPNQTSKKSIVYRQSSWRLHRFSIWTGEPVADVEVLKMSNSLFIWIGSPGLREFKEFALGVPSVFGEDGTCKQLGESTTIVGPVNSTQSAGLAMRLSSALHKPVYVSYSVDLNRFNAPLIEKGLMMEMKKYKDYF